MPKAEEKIAELIHKEWMKWSKDISKKEKISQRTLERWKKYWIPYSKLPENIKDKDRKWAKKAIKMIR